MTSIEEYMAATSKQPASSGWRRSLGGLGSLFSGPQGRIDKQKTLAANRSIGADMNLLRGANNSRPMIGNNYAPNRLNMGMQGPPSSQRTPLVQQQTPYQVGGFNELDLAEAVAAMQQGSFDPRQTDDPVQQGQTGITMADILEANAAREFGQQENFWNTWAADTSAQLSEEQIAALDFLKMTEEGRIQRQDEDKQALFGMNADRVNDLDSKQQAFARNLELAGVNADPYLGGVGVENTSLINQGAEASETLTQRLMDLDENLAIDRGMGLRSGFYEADRTAMNMAKFAIQSAAEEKEKGISAANVQRSKAAAAAAAAKAAASGSADDLFRSQSANIELAKRLGYENPERFANFSMDQFEELNEYDLASTAEELDALNESEKRDIEMYKMMLPSEDQALLDSMMASGVSLEKVTTFLWSRGIKAPLGFGVEGALESFGGGALNDANN
jgi:hypothetical protein